MAAEQKRDAGGTEMNKRIAASFCAGALLLSLLAGVWTGGGAEVSAETAVQAAATQQLSRQAAGAQPAMTREEQAQQTAPAGVAAAAAPDSLALPCRAAILVDQGTGTVLYEQNADTRMPIASITKVMTLLLTFEAIHSGKIALTDTVPVSQHACDMGGSQIWLEPGETFRLSELLKAICVASANDAAVAVAEYVGGSEAAFVSQMNARAAELGMEETSFRNACGLDESGHLSTARDVAVMSRQILTECPEVLQYTGIWMDTLRGGATQLVNTNKLLRHYDGITGLKTGTTGGAGVCISASATRGGLSLIAVVLGAPSSADRFSAAMSLLDYGFANYEAAALPPLLDAPLALAVRGGDQETVELDYSALPQSLLVPRGQGKDLTAELTLPGRIEAPVAAGDAVGSVQVRAGDAALGEYPVRAAQSVKKLDWNGALRLLAENLTSP
jgi:D-alanyl-D-alanine carboxypeptidase (penicillin-binding protein 5/6)